MNLPKAFSLLFSMPDSLLKSPEFSQMSIKLFLTALRHSKLLLALFL